MIELNNSKQKINKALLESKITIKPAFNIFAGTYLDTKVEKDKGVNLLEDKFIKDFSFFEFHEARSYENYKFLFIYIEQWLQSNESINSFIDRTHYLNEYNTNSQRNILKQFLNKIKNEPKSLTTNINLLFNYIYPLVWKKRQQQFYKYNWYILEIGTGIGLGTNLVLDLNKNLYNKHKDIISYNWLSNLFKDFLNDSVIIFLDSKTIVFGVLPKFKEEIVVFECQANHNHFYRFLLSLCLFHSYKYIIITDENQRDFIINAMLLDFKNIVNNLEDTQILLK